MSFTNSVEAVHFDSGYGIEDGLAEDTPRSSSSTLLQRLLGGRGLGWDAHTYASGEGFVVIRPYRNTTGTAKLRANLVGKD